jgi:hypothetical protein
MLVRGFVLRLRGWGRRCKGGVEGGEGKSKGGDGCESEVLGVVELGIGNFERKVEFSIMISRITKHTSPTRLIIRLAI